MAAHSYKYNRDNCPTDKFNNQHGRKKKRKTEQEHKRKPKNDLTLKRKSGIKIKPNKGKTVEKQKKTEETAAFKIFFFCEGVKPM